jgi:hypothetical protein
VSRPWTIRKNPAVHLGADFGRHRTERGVTGKLTPSADQFLQRHVDQVGRVVLGLHGPPDRILSDLPDTRRVVNDAQPGPDKLTMPLGGPGGGLLQTNIIS